MRLIQALGIGKQTMKTTRVVFGKQTMKNELTLR